MGQDFMQCPECPRFYRSVPSLTKHMRVEHTGPPAESPVPDPLASSRDPLDLTVESAEVSETDGEEQQAAHRATRSRTARQLRTYSGRDWSGARYLDTSRGRIGETVSIECGDIVSIEDGELGGEIVSIEGGEIVSIEDGDLGGEMVSIEDGELGGEIVSSEDGERASSEIRELGEETVSSEGRETVAIRGGLGGRRGRGRGGASRRGSRGGGRGRGRVTVSIGAGRGWGGGRGRGRASSRGGRGRGGRGHLGSRSGPIKCHECGKVSSNVWNLGVHLRAVHGYTQPGSAAVYSRGWSGTRTRRGKSLQQGWSWRRDSLQRGQRGSIPRRWF